MYARPITQVGRLSRFYASVCVHKQLNNYYSLIPIVRSLFDLEDPLCLCIHSYVITQDNSG